MRDKLILLLVVLNIATLLSRYPASPRTKAIPSVFNYTNQFKPSWNGPYFWDGDESLTNANGHFFKRGWTFQ